MVSHVDRRAPDLNLAGSDQAQEHRMSITVPRKQIAEMIAHALEQDPEECCGFLLGTGDTVSRSRPVANVHDNKISRYTMDPVDIARIEREADEQGLELVAIYHSHTYTQGYPSKTDVNNAVESGWLGPYYVLVSLVEKTRPVVRAYRIRQDGTVTEAVIETDAEYRGNAE
jgi:[CysO sulfur-carrier protein]-S-L-cysteine hydrolase